ncbi:hypothetical protein ABBQ32_009306 [Trebouxia sp. C0010 RCD-2024]
MCSPSFRLSASSLVTNPLRTQKTCQSAILRRTACTVVRAAAVDSATFYDYSVKDIDGRNTQMKKYKGKVVLAVNVASQCGFTKQYKELGELYSKYQKQGLVILGFPCNQFGGQEPGDNKEIKQFAKSKGAEFPMMGKVEVNGAGADPLYDFLKSQQGGLLTSDVKWNFTKFLIGKDGEVRKRYGSVTTPASIESDIKNALAA